MFSTEHQLKKSEARGFTGGRPQDHKYKNKWTSYYHLQVFSIDFSEMGHQRGVWLHILTHTHKEVNFTAFCQNKLRGWLTIWDRLLGQPLISPIFSLAEERQKEEAQSLKKREWKLFSGVFDECNPLFYWDSLSVCVSQTVAGRLRRGVHAGGCDTPPPPFPPLPSCHHMKHYLVTANGKQGRWGPDCDVCEAASFQIGCVCVCVHVCACLCVCVVLRIPPD